MTRTTHRLLISFYTLLCVSALFGLGYLGYTYFNLPLDQRYRPYPESNRLYELWNPAGLIGHGLGILGSLFIVVGLVSYMARKYLKILSRVGTLKYWLDFHIFMCTLGPILVLYHTTFKFGGIVSVSFWSMVVVWASGVAGRFLYVRIPHSIEGRELSLQEVQSLKDELDAELETKYNIASTSVVSEKYSEIKTELKAKNISASDIKKIIQLIKSERQLGKRIQRLTQMQNLFRYWHVAHLPFAVIMMIIMVIHITVTLLCGQFWIFGTNG
ncbi:MAG: hypothetical protein WCJ03_05010 [Bacteroidales bacterium]